MAKYDFNRATLSFFQDRVRAIAADTPRRWGQMDATRALRHLTFTFEMSLGLQQVPDTSIPVLRKLIYLVFFVWFTNWPKGKIKGPPFVTPEPQGPFPEEQALLLQRMGEFADALERDSARVTLNPGVGAIPLRTWSRVHGVHCDHHLRQFGV